MKKHCCRCKAKKQSNEFYKNRSNKDGLSACCKVCSNLINKISYDKHKKKRAERLAARRVADPEHLRAISKKSYRKNRKKKLAKQKEYRFANKDKIKDANKRYESDNINYKISKRLRTRLYCAIKNNQKVGSAVKDLGCSIDELKIYLESKFQPGMSWDNYGDWHIDHIKPLSSFDLTNKAEFLEACNYKNLQPLWASENLSKGAKS